MPVARLPGLSAVVWHHDQHQPPPPRHQLRHQHPRLLRTQLAVQAGVQKGLWETLKRKTLIVCDEGDRLTDLLPGCTHVGNELPILQTDPSGCTGILSQVGFRVRFFARHKCGNVRNLALPMPEYWLLLPLA